MGIDPSSSKNNIDSQTQNVQATELKRRRRLSYRMRYIELPSKKAATTNGTNSHSIELQAHEKTPLFSAIKQHIDDKVIPFHVPAHKHGTGLKEMSDFTGANTFLMDLNSMRDIDDLSNPVFVIGEAQKLAAQAFRSDHSYFLINGTTSGIHTMMVSALRPGDRIILPRNCHKSAFSGLIMSGAVPIYVPVAMNAELGIATVATYENVKNCFLRAPQTTALFLLNPNYYGFCSDLKELIKLAREWEACVLVDEAHGGHMLFHPELPITAMEMGADMSVVSSHKTCGSLTQSAILLSQGQVIPYERIINTLNMMRSTSASYLLMASLDVARKQLVLHGQDMLQEAIDLVRYAREKINNIEGLYAFGKELVDGKTIADFDETKLCVYVRRLGMTGFEMARRLRQEYRIQVELADLNNIMALVGIGDTKENINALIHALGSIAKKSGLHTFKKITQLPDMPETIVIPRDAFYSHKKTVSLEQSIGEICGEMIMSYPPGIPVICPGERMTRDIVNYINILKEHNCHLQGTADPYVDYVSVLGL